MHRQEVLADCLKNRDVVRETYAIAVELLEVEKKGHWAYFGREHPDGVLSRSVELLEGYLPLLLRLRQTAEAHRGVFESDGFGKLFDTLIDQLGDLYFAVVRAQLRSLKFRNGVLMSAGLGRGNKGAGYILRRDPDIRPAWQKWLFGPHPQHFTFSVHPRDQAGWRNLEALRDRGIGLVASALGQSADHVLSFFQMLRTELAFYVGCINLDECLTALGEHVSFPVPMPAGGTALMTRGLYDVCLALSLGRKVVANDADAGSKESHRHHRRQSGRQVDVPAQRRPGAVDDAKRHVRRSGVLHL